jgi:hypothetical protein
VVGVLTGGVGGRNVFTYPEGAESRSAFRLRVGPGFMVCWSVAPVGVWWAGGVGWFFSPAGCCWLRLWGVSVCFGVREWLVGLDLTGNAGAGNLEKLPQNESRSAV